MKASETRRKAREFLKTLSGKYQLFIVSIVLAILTVSISYRQTIFTTSIRFDSYFKMDIYFPMVIDCRCRYFYFRYWSSLCSCR